MAIVPEALTVEGFAPFGTYRNLREGTGDVMVAEGDGWRDVRTVDPLLREAGHLGMTFGSALPTRVASMERHLHTREALFCLAEPVVLPVAPVTSGDAPEAAQVRAFLLEPGDVVVLDEGVWHDACHGLETPTHYYWHGTEVEGISNDWIPLNGGTVDVVRTAVGPE